MDGATLWKCAPPIRGRANCDALWDALGNGDRSIAIVTDHSPCPPEMKGLEAGRFDAAWGGIAGLSVALPVIYTECIRRGFGLEEIVRWMSSAPARLAGIANRAGALAVGREASFCVFDTDATFTVTPEKLHFRHAVSPYVGETLRGVVKATYLRGEAVYEDGGFVERTSGKEVRLS